MDSGNGALPLYEYGRDAHSSTHLHTHAKAHIHTPSLPPSLPPSLLSPPRSPTPFHAPARAVSLRWAGLNDGHIAQVLRLVHPDTWSVDGRSSGRGGKGGEREGQQGEVHAVRRIRDSYVCLLSCLAMRLGDEVSFFFLKCMLCDEFVTAMCVPALLSCHAAWRRGEFVREPGVCVCVPCVCVCVCECVSVCASGASDRAARTALKGAKEERGGVRDCPSDKAARTALISYTPNARVRFLTPNP